MVTLGGGVAFEASAMIGDGKVEVVKTAWSSRRGALFRVGPRLAAADEAANQLWPTSFQGSSKMHQCDCPEK